LIFISSEEFLNSGSNPEINTKNPYEESEDNEDVDEDSNEEEDEGDEENKSEEDDIDFNGVFVEYLDKSPGNSLNFPKILASSVRNVAYTLGKPAS